MGITDLISGGPTPSWAAVVTAGASFLTAFGGVVLSVTVLIPLLRTAKSTHVLVNQANTDLRNYQAALKRALNAAGVAIPEDQSKPGTHPPVVFNDPGDGES